MFLFANVYYHDRKKQSTDLLYKSMDWFLYDRNLCHGSLNRSLPTTKWGLILSDPSPLLTFIDGYKIYYLEVTNYTIYLANLFFQSKLSLLSHLTPLPVRAYLILIYPIPSSLKKLIFSILQKTNPPTTFVFDKERKRLVLKQLTLFTYLLYLMRTGTNSNSNITQPAPMHLASNQGFQWKK